MMLQRLASSLFLTALTLIFVATALAYDPESRQVPMAVAIVALVLLAVDMLSQCENRLGKTLRRTFGGIKAMRPGADADPGDAKKEIAAFLWIAAFTALAVVAGFYIAIPIYVVAYLVLYAGRPVWIAGLIAVCLTAALYLLFAVLLGYDIFEGLVFGGFM